MTTYKSGEAEIAVPIEKLYSRVSTPSLLKDMAAGAPAEVAEKLKDVTFGEDSITFAVPPVGQIMLKLTEKVEPSKVEYQAVQSPVPFSIAMEMKKVDDSHTLAEASINIDIPVFLKPMLDGKMKEMATQFRTLMAQMAIK
ncbi:MAG: hypothetical protein K2J74_06295 [Muribaculaceae bacterium]|nr:hypothetical protein [Muribaculaceae bacterium]